LGLNVVIFNISLEEAKRRYCESEEVENIDPRLVNEFDFEDEFVAYDVYEKD
jgi:hypothetical protein